MHKDHAECVLRGGRGCFFAQVHQGRKAMELDHEFTVPVPVDHAWPVLLDVERIAPCMPGATLDSVDGDEFTGRLKVKLGAMTITYKGSARIASRDEDAHTVTIEGTGKEARGSGTASATVQAQLHAEGDRTRVTVHTKLNITGRPAQFGRNIMAEVGGKLIGRFADNLAAEIVSPAAATKPEAETGAETGAASGDGAPKAAETTEAPVASKAEGDGTPKAAEKTPTPAPQAAPSAPAETKPAAPRASEDEAINLLEFAGPSIAKRVAPVVAALAGLWVFRRLIRRKRR
jgi:carbon monoxide dehydrogenase subunit G